MAKARGEGERRKGKFRSSTSTSNFNYKALVAGLIVVIGGGIAAWLMMSGREAVTDTEGNRGSRAIAEAKPAVSARDALIAEAKDRPKKERKKIELIPGKPAVELPNVIRQTPELTAAEEAAIRRPWKSTTEQLLVQLLACPPGLPPKPISVLPKEEMDDMLNILTFQAKAEEGDDEGDQWAKGLINEGKKMMVDFVADGGEPYDFFRYYHDELDKACEMRNTVGAEIQRIIDEEGDFELARSFQKTVNEKLEAEGIAPVDFDFDFAQEEKEEQEGK